MQIDNVAHFTVMDSILYYIYYAESSIQLWLFFLFGPFFFYVSFQLVYFGLHIGPAATLTFLGFNFLILWVIHKIYLIISTIFYYCYTLFNFLVYSQ